MPSIIMTFEGVFTHLAKSSNPDLEPPYRVSAPLSGSSNAFGTTIVLGSLSPSVVINGNKHTGPLVITVSAPTAGAPALPPTKWAPSLRGMSAQAEIDPAIAYATFPADDRILLNIGIPAVWEPLSSKRPLLTLRSADITGLSVTLQTSANGSAAPIAIQPLNTLAFSNLPVDPTVPANEWETLLGFLGVSNEIPADAKPPAAGVSMQRPNRAGATPPKFPLPVPTPFPQLGIDVSQPGCTNSQWP